MNQDDDVDDLNPLVDGIHSVAVAPDRLETLLDIWSMRLHRGSSAAARFNLLDDPELLAHVEQAGVRLHHVVGAMDAARPAVVAWVNAVRNAAVAVTRKGFIAAANPAAIRMLGASAGCSIEVFDLEDEYQQILLAEIASIRGSSGETARMLRLRRRQPESPIVVRLIEGAGGDPLVVGIIVAIVAWPENLGTLVQDVFGLTASEADVLKGLVLGLSVKEIAAASGRSEPTIRSHVSALLDKTETRSQVELIRLTLALLAAAEPGLGQPSLMNGPVPQAGAAFSTLILEDQRRLDYLVIGHPRGATFVLMPGGVGTNPFPPKDEQELFRRGLRMIVPIRAGFGGSSPLPHGRHVHEVTASDTFALMDHLGLNQVPFVTICDDFRIAIALAARAPERMAAIIGCGASMPAVTHEHYFRMSKWRRFASANARFAPRAMPYLAMAIFSVARRLGPKRFLHALMAESPADLKVIADESILLAIANGADVALSSSLSAHVSWAAETAANWASDWSDELRSCPVPITLFAGHQDPLSPFQTVKDYAAEMPHIQLFDFPDCGQLLHPYIPKLFDVIEGCVRYAVAVQPGLR